MFGAGLFLGGDRRHWRAQSTFLRCKSPRYLQTCAKKKASNLEVLRVIPVGDKRYATMSVATNYCYKGADGCPVIETTWHIVTVWEGNGCPDLSIFRKGDQVHVTGRLRCRKYIDVSGMEKTQMEIDASSLEKE